MAPIKPKEAIIVAIDIGKNSLELDADGKNCFTKALFCTSMILKRKLLTESKDEIALILFGSSKTNNHLSIQSPCYNNIEIVISLGIVTWDLLKHVTNITSTDISPSDWLSTLVVATDILKTETEEKIFSNLQIVMFSNFNTNIPLNNIDNISRSIQRLNINLTMIGEGIHNPVLVNFTNEAKIWLICSLFTGNVKKNSHRAAQVYFEHYPNRQHPHSFFLKLQRNLRNTGLFYNRGNVNQQPRQRDTLDENIEIQVLSYVRANSRVSTRHVRFDD